MGIGKSGEIVDQKKLKIKIGSLLLQKMEKFLKLMTKKIKGIYEGSIEIEVNLKLGNDALNVIIVTLHMII